MRQFHFGQVLVLLSGLVATITFAIPAPVRAQAREFRLATFSADVTPPLGHPLLGGTTTPPPAHAVDDPLFARGFVLIGSEKPVVVVTIDWCEIRNDAYDRWRDVLAEAAGTTRQCVLVSSIHQHDTPLADLEAQRILDRSKLGGSLIDLEFHERCVQRTASALRAAIGNARRVTHVGTASARVAEVASNRRYLGPGGVPRFDRSSMSGGATPQRDAPEETIDPFLRTLSFWDGDVPVCALHVYAVHPMSHWGSGRVTADFPGLARSRRQADAAGVFQIYASGCSGNVTAGKYNDGNPASKKVLADRLYQAMVTAWQTTERRPLERATFRSVALGLPPRESPGYTVADMQKQLEHPDSKKRCLAALGLSWRKRIDAKQPIDLPALDLGSAVVVLLPGESYVEFQLVAQSLRADTFVLALGYGESAAGYVPIEQAWRENDGNLDTWCWTAPGAELVLLDGLKAVLAADKSPPGDRDDDDKSDLPRVPPISIIRFAEHVIADKYDYAYGVVAADLDEDGDIDLTSQNVVGGQINLSSMWWFENDGKGKFQRRLIHKDDGDIGWYERHAVGDLNGDGKLDVAVVDNKFGRLVWFANNDRPAAGPWQRYIITTQSPRVYDVALADLDGDGDLDAADAGYANGQNCWYENPGPAGWDKEWVRRVVGDKMPEARTIAAADFNGDGKIDLLAASVGVEKIPAEVTDVNLHGGRIVWYENTGRPATEPWKKHTIDSTGRAPIHGHPADLDGDGDLDVVMAHGMRQELLREDQHDVAWYENIGQPGKGLDWKRHTISRLPFAFEAVASDLDSDGDVDVVATAWAKGDRVVWFENSGNSRGRWTMHIVTDKFNAANQVIVADLDGDRRPDLAATADSGSSRSVGAQAFRWWRNEGTAAEAAKP